MYEVRIIDGGQERVRFYKERAKAKVAYHNAKTRYKQADVGLYDLSNSTTINHNRSRNT